jgi:hypothetical protein
MYKVLREILPTDVVRHICELSVTKSDCRRYKNNKQIMLREIDNEYDEDFIDCQNANWIEYCTQHRFENFVNMCRFHGQVMEIANDFDYSRMFDEVEMWINFYDNVKELTKKINAHVSPRILSHFFECRNRNHPAIFYIPHRQ